MSFWIGLQSFTALLIYFYFFIFAEVGNAQTQNFKHYNISDGLVQSQVFSILQDKDGYLWFSTANGLSRFDGLNFTTITQSDGLADIEVTASYADDNGDLWFGHGNGKVTRFNWKKQNFEILPVSNDSSRWASTSITKIFKQQNGILWFVTLGEGVFGFRADTVIHLNTPKGLRDDYVFDGCEVSDGSLWFATRDGITIYYPEPSKGKSQIDSVTTENGLPTNFILSLLADRNGNIWIGTREEGLVRYTPHDSRSKQGEWVRFGEEDGLAHNWIMSLYQDRDGQIWAGTFDGGISKYVPEDGNGGKGYFRSFTTDNGLSSNCVLTIFEDIEGNIWLGTNGGGVNRFRDQGYEIYGIKEGLVEKVVWNIQEDRYGNYWFGADRGITKYTPPRTRTGKALVSHFTRVEDTPIRLVHDLILDSKDILWALSYGNALIRIDPKSDRLQAITPEEGLPSVSLMCLNEDDQGNLWFGTFREGIIKYNPRLEVFEEYQTINNEPVPTVHTIFKDKAGNLWFGTSEDGIILYDGKEFRHYSEKNGYDIPSAVSIAQDSQGKLWLVTYKGELFCFDGNQFYNYSRLEELHKNYFYSVVCEGEHVWLGTSLGIIKFNPQDRTLTYLGKEEGYPALETNQDAVYIDSKGSLWFGTIGGAVKIDPSRFRLNPIPPPVKLTGLKLFLKQGSFPPDNQFSYDQNYLTFQFQGICLTAPQKMRYSYKLEGFDRDWSPPSRENFATYSNLPPGRYAFKVMAQNNDGVWSSQPGVYEFTILAPFWQTWWFDALVILTIIFGVVAAHKFRVRKVEKDRMLLERRVEERTAELMSEKEKVEKAFHALRESEEKFRAFTETTSSAIIIYQGDYFKYVNREAEVLTGYSREELLKMKFWDVVASEFQELIRERGKARQRGENVPPRYEFKIITKSGEERWVDFVARAIELDGAAAALGTAVDITERKLAEVALAEQKERLAVTLRSIADGVITTDTKGRIVLMNKVAEELTGFSFKEAIDKKLQTVFKIVNQKSGKQIQNPVTKVLKTGEVITLDQDTALVCRDHSQRLISCSAAPIGDRGTRVMGTVLVFRDITEHRQLEEELLKMQKLESVGLLAGGIAHDFNNILTVILGNISVAKMHMEEENSISKRLNDAEKACFRARDLTQQLLTFSRGGAPVRETTRIEEIIKESVDFILRGSAVQCEFHLPENLWMVKVDSGQISQVIQNLALNAKQAMPQGGKIRVRAANVRVTKNSGLPLKAGNYLRISVEDEGIGIAREHWDKVFDPYFTTKQQGNGLGLTTAYSIIKRHEGHIHVESKLGEGTTFYLYLPATGQKPKAPTKSREAFTKSVGRILFMDDEEMVQETTASLLQELGYQVELASDGEEALQKYQEFMDRGTPFDIVILDLTVPGGMGGELAIQKLREIDPRVTAVVTSGYSNDAIMSHYEDYGFKGCLKKPFNVEDMNRVLRQLVEKSAPIHKS
ncbi:MAG: hypothetical protein Kow0042_06430 [Calditrichia bacterium]